MIHKRGDNLPAEDEPADLRDYLDRMRPVVDSTIRKLGSASFREDPIAGRKYSRATSIMGSAYKRHGAILEMALLERLKDCSRFRVWTEQDFKLSHESLTSVRIADRMEPLLRTELPYGDRERAIRVDVLLFDTDSQTLTSYNVKRGNGSYDGGKRRLIQEDLLRTHMLLSDYGRSLGLQPEKAHAHIIFYYGLLSLPRPLALAGADLNEHFGFEVVPAIETVNDYFVRRLHALIEDEC
jgi:hypothetical protein